MWNFESSEIPGPEGAYARENFRGSGRQFQLNRHRPLTLFSLVLACAPALVRAQCAGDVSTPRGAADCTASATPQSTTASLDAKHSYTLAELIDLAEHNNPRTRVAWERAKQRAAQLGLA